MPIATEIWLRSLISERGWGIGYVGNGYADFADGADWRGSSMVLGLGFECVKGLKGFVVIDFWEGV
jgi:hypothetical protein